jgi:hypothetical protein
MAPHAEQTAVVLASRSVWRIDQTQTVPFVTWITDTWLPVYASPPIL